MEGAALSVLLALWVQGALALALIALLGVRRVPRIVRGEIALSEVALSREPWPEAARKASNAVDNQFQLPVLLYLGSAGLLYLGASAFEAAVIWLFVATRVAHAVIHVTTNNVGHRFFAYAAGFALVVVLWAALLFRIVQAMGAL